MTEDKRCKVLIGGDVQGVRYRAYAKVSADNNNVKGYAKNLPDSRVEVVAEGDEMDILSFLLLLRTGPPNAVVDDFVVEWGEAKNEFTEFRIL